MAYIVAEVFDDGRVEEGRDCIEDPDVHAVGDEEQYIAGVPAEVLDGLQVALLLALRPQLLRPVGRGRRLILEC